MKLKDNWNKLSGKLKKRFTNTTDNDLLFIEESEEELWRKREEKLAKTKDELSKMISKS